jgi:hypothetical protein
MPEPELSMHAVYCNTEHCVQTGNAAKEIRVWGIPAREYQNHEIKCPWCGGIVERRLKLQTVVKISTGLE